MDLTLSGPNKTDVTTLGREALERACLDLMGVLASITFPPSVHYYPDSPGDVVTAAQAVTSAMNRAREEIPANIRERYLSVGCSIEGAEYLTGLCRDVVDEIAGGGDLSCLSQLSDLEEQIRDRETTEYVVKVPVYFTVRASSEANATELVCDTCAVSEGDVDWLEATAEPA